MSIAKVPDSDNNLFSSALKLEWSARRHATILKNNEQYNPQVVETIRLSKDLLLAEFGLDVEALNTQTFAQVGADIMLSTYLKQEVHPHCEISGKLYLTGELNKELRRLALKAPTSALNDCLVAGVLLDVELWDVVSMYPSALMLQPLPNAQTKLVRITSVDQLVGLEGIVEVEFEYPKTENYAALNCEFVKERELKSVFTLAGTTTVTVCEVLYAMSLGCKITKISGIGFIPTENEYKHDLIPYCQKLLSLKGNATKGTAAYSLWKGIMNMGFGKFYQKNEFSGEIKPGRLFVPEWYILMVGRARRLQTELMRTNNAIWGYTDSIAIRKGTQIVLGAALTALRSVGSDLARECEGTFWSPGKPGVYAIVSPDFDKVIHGGNYSGDHAHQDPEEEKNKEHAKQILVCLHEQKLNKKCDLVKKTSGYSVFRRFTKKENQVNLFSSSVNLVPYSTPAACESAKAKELNSKRRPKKITREQVKEILRTKLDDGIAKAIRTTSKEVHLSERVLYEILDEIKNELK